MILSHGGYDFWFYLYALFDEYGWIAIPVIVLVPLIIILNKGLPRVSLPEGPLSHCRKCSYDLRGLTSARCPECGTESDVPG